MPIFGCGNYKLHVKSRFGFSRALLNNRKDEHCVRLKNPPQAVYRKRDIFHFQTVDAIKMVKDFAIKICQSTAKSLHYSNFVHMLHLTLSN